MSSGRVRYSIAYIQSLYDSGENRSMLENLIRAFRGIQALPPDNENSFFYLGSLHGMPFNKPGDDTHTNDEHWWGGYCWHDTILFPTWHRIYLLKLEDALRSIPGCQDVTLPFWDELANVDDPEQPVIPTVLTSPNFDLDGRTDNPLFSYRLQKALDKKEANNMYSKPEGYNTVRYPFSGLMGTEKEQSEAHNAAYTQDSATLLLNQNVTQWLNGTVQIPKIPGEPDDDNQTGRPDTYSVSSKYYRCLFAPNYTVFSNTSSQNQWIIANDSNYQPGKPSHYVVSLESPHNAVHLAVGGFYQQGVYNASPIPGANGDMGDNETAGFDPIFYLHHCFIDYTFSIWQRIHGLTQRGSLHIQETYIDKDGCQRRYPGTILEAGQPYFAQGTELNMETTLLPFKKADGDFYTSEDATDISELGFAYDVRGSLEGTVPPLGRATKTIFETIRNHVSNPRKVLGHDSTIPSPFSVIKRVHNINRAQYPSSFVIRLYARGYDGKEVEVGREAILSRSNLEGCANCQNHLNVEMHVPIDPVTLERLAGPTKADVEWVVKVHTRDGQIHEPKALAAAALAAGQMSVTTRVPIVEDL